MRNLHRITLAAIATCQLGLAAAQVGPALPTAQPILSPDRLAAQVAAQESESGAHPTASPLGSASLPLVPAPPASLPGAVDSPAPPPLSHRAPTLADRHRLEAQLLAVDGALKVHEVTEANTQHATQAIFVKGKMLFTYAEGGIYEITAATFHETAIVLQPGEVLTGKDLPTAGDTTRWTLTATRAGTAPNEITVLIVKPLEAELETNMTITTNRRIYTVILKSSEHTYMPLVGWVYPEDEARAQQDELARKIEIEAQAEEIRVPPESLNFNCSVSGSTVPWRPIRVYDDGAKTYLQMSPGMASYEAPALFVMEKSDPLLVNYRVKHGLYIVDRLFERAQLRVGAKNAVDIRCTRLVASR